MRRSPASHCCHVRSVLWMRAAAAVCVSLASSRAARISAGSGFEEGPCGPRLGWLFDMLVIAHERPAAMSESPAGFGYIPVGSVGKVFRSHLSGAFECRKIPPTCCLKRNAFVRLPGVLDLDHFCQQAVAVAFQADCVTDEFGHFEFLVCVDSSYYRCEVVAQDDSSMFFRLFCGFLPHISYFLICARLAFQINAVLNAGLSSLNHGCSFWANYMLNIVNSNGCHFDFLGPCTRGAEGSVCCP